MKAAAGLTVVGLLLSGCKGIERPDERQARSDLASVGHAYRVDAAAPRLDASAGLSNYLEFAMLTQPQVRAAFFDWAESVERITVERSMPDPKLTFQAYITDVLTSLMPGLAQDFPGPGKLKAAGKVASDESRTKYFAFETATLQAAFGVKQAYYQLWFLDEKIRIQRDTLNLLAGLERIARAQNEVGKVTLQDVYRAQIERDQVTTDTANLEDSRRPMMAQFKAALGLTRDQPDPPPPTRFEGTPLEFNGEELLDAAFARNPRLKAMESDVRTAQDSITLAGKSKTPDFSAGLMAEVYEPPFYWPQASMSLPIWRDKIAAQIAAAQAGKHAAEARLSAEQIGLTVEFAMKTYDFREVTRNLALLQNQLIPKARQSLSLARSSYLGGQSDFFNLIDTERTLLNLQLKEVEARARREIILADLSLSIAGIAPPGAPVLR
ncbi:MAG: TolC family protein [Limisphaerales bacterium]